MHPQPANDARAAAHARAAYGEPLLRRPVITRGAVTVTFDPVDVSWNGIRVPLSRTEALVFALVAQRGRAPWADINQALTEAHACLQSRDVLIFRLRHKFAEVGAANPLQTVRGWGLRFRMEPSASGSRTIWIGRSEPADEGPFPMGEAMNGMLRATNDPG